MLTGREAVEQLEQRLCGAPVEATPQAAEGLAAAGTDAASSGSIPPGPRPPASLAGSCVHHHFGGGRLAGDDDIALAPADAQEALDLTVAARLLARRLRHPVGVRHGDYADALVAVSMPLDLPASADVSEPSAAAAAVAAATGRDLSLVARSGSADAPLVLVGVGPAGLAAGRLAAAFTAAGLPSAAVVVRQLHPAPVAALTEALTGAKRVITLRAPGGLHLRSATVRACANAAAVASAPIPAPSGAPLEALAEAVAAVLPDALPALPPTPSEPRFRLAAVPAGTWASGVVRALAHDHVTGEQWQAVEAPAGAGGVVVTGPTPADGPDVLVAAGPGFLDADGPLGAMAPGGIVVVCAADADASVDGLVAALAPALRTFLAERQLTLRHLEAGAEDPLAVIRAAARGEAGTPIPTELLTAPAPAAEVDFRPGAGLPERAPGTDEETPEHSPAAVRHFHQRGAAASALPTPLGAPVAARGTAATMVRRWPCALVRRDPAAPPIVETLEQTLATALEAAPPTSRLGEAVVQLAHELRRAHDAASAPLADRLSATGDALAAALDLDGEDATALSEDLGRVAAALPPALLLPLADDAPIRIAADVLDAVAEEARRALGARAARLYEGLNDRLTLDRLQSDEGRSPDVLGASLGLMPGIDPARLASSLPSTSGAEQLSDERRDRMTAVATTLQAWASDEAPRVMLVGLRDGGPVLPDGSDALLHDDPLAAAVGLFRGHARRLEAVVRAARTAELELADEWRTDVHEDALASLDWQGLTREELAAAPAVVAVVPASHLRGSGATGLERLLRSGEPVRVLVVDDGRDPPDEFHSRASWRGVASREAVVVAGSAARPERWAEGVACAASAPRPAVLEVTLPEPGPSAWRELRAELALHGRSTPELRYLPDAGPELADRVDGGGNPDPTAAWPRTEIALRDGGILEAAVTHADALAMDPAWRDHFRPLAPAEEAADQLPVAEWLETLGPEAQAWIPFVEVVGDDGVVRRAVLTRELGLACADRLRSWRVLQDAAGFDNAWARRAAVEAAEQAGADAEARAAEAEARHHEELERVRTDTARDAFAHLAQALLDAGGGALTTPGPGRTPAPAAAPPPSAAPSAPADSDVPTNGAAAPAAEEAGGVSFDEAYIDSFLCTTCNECTNLNGAMFKYDGDKQAYLADLNAGTFEELVKAAELCPAKCIHPGAPRSGDALATSDLVARAAPFN